MLQHPPNMFRMINLKRFSDEQHRYGWNEVTKYMSQYHSDDASTLMDDFLDLSFFRRQQPYLQPWIGIFHCPVHVSEPFLNVGLETTVLKDVFQKSLPYCRGLFTLSEHLRNGLIQTMNYPDLPTDVLYHPTSYDVPQFNYGAFRANPKMLQIGYWMREFSMYHHLSSPYVKYALLTKNIPPQVERHVRELSKEIDTVNYMKYLPNLEYDRWLQDSLVFLHFRDTSANNAIVDCIARATPLLVDKHPAVMEYLGEDYPLYFRSREEAEVKLRNNNLILQAHLHLQTPAVRDRLTYEAFGQKLLSSKVTLSCSI